MTKHILAQYLAPARHRDPKSLESYVGEVIENLEDSFYKVLSSSPDGLALSEQGDAVLEAEATGLAVRVFLEIDAPDEMSESDTAKMIAYAQRAIGFANLTL